MQEVALETAINSIRVRFGSQALTRAAELPPPQPWSSGTPANRSGTVVVGIVDTPNRALAHASSFSLGFARSEWIYERGRLVGLRTSARCVKNRVAPPIGETELEIRYPLGSHDVLDFTPGVTEVSAEVMEVETYASAAV